MNLDILKNNFNPQEILAGSFGIEREGLRVKKDGTLAVTPHPKVFGSKLENPYITTDFSESQVEVVTPPYESIPRAVEVLETLVDIVNNEVREHGELLWPASMPCVAPGDIPVAEYGDNPEAQKEHDYRLGLIKKYGGLKQLLTGIHFNFSFSDEFLEKLRKLEDPDMNLQEFKNKVYLKVARNYLRYRWLIIYLTGCSASMHESYDCVNLDYVIKDHKDSIIMKNGPSLRNSACGYKNLIDLFPRFDSVEHYTEDVRNFVKDGFLSQPKELYMQVRLKTGDKGDILKSLEEKGIQYLEFRTLDLNLFSKSGVNERDLEFIQLFVLFCLLTNDSEKENEEWQKEALENENVTAVKGLLPDLKLKKDGKEIVLKEWAHEIFDEIEKINKELNLGKSDILYEMKTRVDKPFTTYAANMATLSKAHGYIDSMMKFAERYSDNSYLYRYLTQGYNDYELSTQILIKEALTRGVKVTEIDPSDNFIELEAKGKKEYVKQANKTSLDNYVSVEGMGNKVVTKKILESEGIRVPKGEQYHNIDSFKAHISRYVDKPIVIKPKSTNYGIGIFVFENGANEEDLIKAAEDAFTYDDSIIVEEFIKGEEFRFLIIGGEVVAVLERIPANVVGNGKDSILELIYQKNQDPLRGEGYSAPMKKIKVDDQTILYLKNKGLTLDSIPEEDEVVYLRGNSNISTGGDSIDITEEMPEKYKEIAKKAAKAINANFCGVDLMIENFNDPNSDFGIIELNFNPSMDMHAYPKEGKEHKTGAYILSALGLIDEDIKEIKAKEKQPYSFSLIDVD